MEPFAVLFDLDGLMLDTERMAIAAWTHALTEWGYSPRAVSFGRLIGLTASDTAAVLYEIYGPEFPYPEVFAKRNSFYEDDIETNGIPVKPGLLELLDYLEANQVVKAVASSTPCWFAPRKLAHAGLDQRFNVVICGDMVQRGKPAPDLFLEAARQLNVPPESCIVLEDSEVGILAARAAGMLPVMIPDLKPPAPEVGKLAFRVLHSLKEVIPLMDDFLRNGLPADFHNQNL